MANLTIIQGRALPINIDSTNFGAIDALQVELVQGNNSAVKFRYPATVGYEALTKVNSIYTAQLTTAISGELLGLYDLEITAFVGTQETAKGTASDFIMVNQQGL